MTTWSMLAASLVLKLMLSRSITWPVSRYVLDGQHNMVDSGLIGANMAGGPDVLSHVQQEDDLDHSGCKVGKPGAGTVV